MAPGKWSDQETAAAVYFASRNADHLACSTILRLKYSGRDGGRTEDAVRNKLDEVRGNNTGLWFPKSGWDLGKVDEWLVAQQLPDLGVIMEVGFQELQAVAPENREAFMKAVFAPSILNEQKETGKILKSNGK